ncbi:MAG: hypothetical protein HY678_02525 [Chloroflexi bacterium]|nr:hypothetical protein [Chloroflexota bacterium]
MTTAMIPEVATLVRIHMRLAAIERRMTELERAAESTVCQHVVNTPKPTPKPTTPGPLVDRSAQAARTLEAVAGYTNISVDEIVGRRREKRTALARQVAAYLLVTHVGLSTVATGRSVESGSQHGPLRH